MPNLEDLTDDELRDLLNVWQHKKFMLAMADHWSRDDYEFSTECTVNILDIEDEMKKRGIYGTE